MLDVSRFEIEMKIKELIPVVFDKRLGNELVDSFIQRASNESLTPLASLALQHVGMYLCGSEYS